SFDQLLGQGGVVHPGISLAKRPDRRGTRVEPHGGLLGNVLAPQRLGFPVLHRGEGVEQKRALLIETIQRGTPVSLLRQVGAALQDLRTGLKHGDLP
ncbi:MAG: hypothetical protein ACK55I_29795, partial [bacterium]